MEKISSSETLRDVINGMAVQGTVHKDTNHPENSRIENGQVMTEDGQYLASWWLNGDNSFGMNCQPQVTYREAVLTAIETFINEATEVAK
ncbi:MAG: hypothetical protein K2K70_13630 [Lachnospiraceae bacterium]|nr:hypothetical protein [Lachnospiraceae bacterium]